MIRLGFAHEYTYDLPYRYRDAFIAPARDARTAGRGLLAGDTCDGNTTKPAG
jgi:micrococcal nuclease